MKEPEGLSQYSDFTRWRIISGDNYKWVPYGTPDSYVDQLALNGLYHISVNNIELAKFNFE
jgi:hypothetical protein